MDTKATAQPQATISAVVTRADGTVEDLGVIGTTTVQVSPGLKERIMRAVRKDADNG